MAAVGSRLLDSSTFRLQIRRNKPGMLMKTKESGIQDSGFGIPEKYERRQPKADG
jgi:hypothetical protein